jgi:exocyst complex component 3
MEDRTTNKMWLVRHLEVTRQLVLEDLRVVKVDYIFVSMYAVY